MKKKVFLFISVLILFLASCATTSYFIGTLGGVYYSTDDYSDEKATTSVNNYYSDLKDALWMYNKKSKPSTQITGSKVLFYCDLEEDGFFNEFVPDKYRATSMKDAGFIIIAEESDPVFYSTFAYQNGTKVKVNYSTGKLVLYSIKTGEKLYTGSSVKGPTPPKEFSVYAGTTEVSWDDPKPEAFKSAISTICTKIAGGNITGCVTDEAAMAASGYEVSSSKPAAQTALNITGVWKATDGDYSFTYTFTSDGWFVREEYNAGLLTWCSVQPFVIEENTIVVDGSDKIKFNYSSKKLTLEGFSDECTFKQTSKTAVNKASEVKLYGVWESESSNGSFKLGLANTGFMIFQGSDYGMGNFSADEKTIHFNKYNNSEYWIINDTLYFEDDGLFDYCYATLRFKKLATGGKDTTSRTVLTAADHWDYVSESGDNLNRFYFQSNGNFKDEYFYKNEKQSTANGTFTFTDHVIQLSDGRELSFAVIDSHAFGYSM